MIAPRYGFTPAAWRPIPDARLDLALRLNDPTPRRRPPPAHDADPDPPCCPGPGLRHPAVGLQLREILGTPLLADPFHADRWDYAFTIRRQGVPDQQRRVTVFFRNDVVERFETDALPSEREFVASIDRPLGGEEPKLQMTPEQVAALPVPLKTESTRKVPQGAAREYPPLEAGSR